MYSNPYTLLQKETKLYQKLAMRNLFSKLLVRGRTQGGGAGTPSGGVASGGVLTDTHDVLADGTNSLGQGVAGADPSLDTATFHGAFTAEETFLTSPSITASNAANILSAFAHMLFVVGTTSTITIRLRLDSIGGTIIASNSASRTQLVDTEVILVGTTADVSAAGHTVLLTVQSSISSTMAWFGAVAHTIAALTGTSSCSACSCTPCACSGGGVNQP